MKPTTLVFGLVLLASVTSAFERMTERPISMTLHHAQGCVTLDVSRAPPVPEDDVPPMIEPDDLPPPHPQPAPRPRTERWL